MIVFVQLSILFLSVVFLPFQILILIFIVRGIGMLLVLLSLLLFVLD